MFKDRDPVTLRRVPNATEIDPSTARLRPPEPGLRAAAVALKSLTKRYGTGRLGGRTSQARPCLRPAR